MGHMFCLAVTEEELAELEDLARQFADAMARINETLDAHLERAKRQNAKIDAAHAEIEKRLAALDARAAAW